MAMFSETAPAAVPVEGQRDYRVASAILMALFFAIGFLTCLNDIIVPHFKAIFTLDYTRAMLIQFSFFTAYFVISGPSGIAVRKLGYKRAIVLGLGVASLGCIGFYPAAVLRSYGLFLAALFVLASGFTLLQVAMNPYVAILGSRETASARLTLTQAFNSLGTFIAPFFGAAFILSPVETSDHTDAARSVEIPYLAFAAVLAAMGCALWLFRLPHARPDEEASTGESLWSHAPLVFGTIAIFVYVGAEVAIGSLLVSFLHEASAGGIDAQTAARCVAIYWGGAMVGRFIGAFVLRSWSPSRVLAGFAGMALALVGTTILLGAGRGAMATILCVGLFNSIMFPTIFTLAIDGLGARTGEGSGVLCMAIVGGAIVPVLEGAVADHVGVHVAFVVPLVCYAYIVWYGLHGSTMRFRPRGEGKPAAG
jgi:MFS transporter, FHS family, L-fucose permease